jgi:ribonucleotide reductase alpha subunit
MKTEFIGKEQEIFMREGKYIFAEETPQQRYQEIVDRIREYEDQYGKGLADRLEYMIDENILSLSTPIIANFGRKYKEEKNTYPLPVSCNIVSVGNSISDIYESIGQVAMLSKLGAGVGADWQLVCDKNTKLAEGFYYGSGRTASPP